MMKVLAIKDGDIYMDRRGNLAHESELEAIRQRITEYLRSIKGDWILDVNHGLPYMTDIFIIGVTNANLRQVYEKSIRSFPEVTGLNNSFSEINSMERTYTFSADVYTIYGVAEIRING